MKFLSAAILVAVMVTSCSKEDIQEPVENQVTSEVNTPQNQRNWKVLGRSCCAYVVCCKPSGGTAGNCASSPTRWDARDWGRENCGSLANTDIFPAFEQMQFANALIASPLPGTNNGSEEFVSIIPPGAGTYQGTTIKDVRQEEVFHPASSISFDEMLYWVGEPTSNVSDERKAIVHLMIFGIYQGGTTAGAIQENHNLTEDNYNSLINRNFTEEFQLDYDDETYEMSWVF